MSTKPRATLGQSLAVQTQMHLPGTVGRLLKQVRDVEEAGKQFQQAGLVRPIDRPQPLDLKVAGIACKSQVCKILGGFIYVAGAARCDLQVEKNALQTIGQDSVCSIDDIDFEHQTKRMKFNGVRQAYELLERLLTSEFQAELILLDTPLLLDLSYRPHDSTPKESGYRKDYDRTIETITQFWNTYRERLYPWNKQGPMVAAIQPNFSGLVKFSFRTGMSQKDRQEIFLACEGIKAELFSTLPEMGNKLEIIGEKRFLWGALPQFSRTCTMNLAILTERKDPEEVMKLGLIGYHYRAGTGTDPSFLQFMGREEWDVTALDKVAACVMALTAHGGGDGWPIPNFLAQRELQALEPFLKNFSTQIRKEISDQKIENIWLSDLSENI
ncbi:MAG: hypothetical protein WA705_22415 [Candidatus Ozemobacteraceae bacterium]